MRVVSSMGKAALLAAWLGGAANAAADGNTACERLFDAGKDLIRAGEAAESEQARFQRQDRLAAAQMQAVTAYLNQCAGPKATPGRAAPEWQRLTQLAGLGCEHPQAELEWLDVDQDGHAELVLHGASNGCDGSVIYQEGWTGVFFRDVQSGTWTGRLVWPTEAKDALSFPPLELFAQYKPALRMTGLVDAAGARYMTLESEFQGADHTARQLLVVRWLGQSPQDVLALRLTDWCAQPTDWTFQANGTLTIPAAKATYRCAARAGRRFALFSGNAPESPPISWPSMSWLAADQQAQAFADLGKILDDPEDEAQAAVALARAKARPVPAPGQRPQARAENSAGLAALKEGRAGEAAARFAKALQADAGDVEAWNNLGYALLRDGNPDDAEVVLLYTLVLQPGRSNAWANLGMAYAKQGDLERSAAALSAAYRFSANRAKTGEFMKALAETEGGPVLREACRRASAFAARRFPSEPAPR